MVRRRVRGRNRLLWNTLDPGRARYRRHAVVRAAIDRFRRLCAGSHRPYLASGGHLRLAMRRRHGRGVGTVRRRTVGLERSYVEGRSREQLLRRGLPERVPADGRHATSTPSSRSPRQGVRRPGRGAAAAEAAEIVIIDTSGSMEYPSARSTRPSRRPRPPSTRSATACCSASSPATTSASRSTRRRASRRRRRRPGPRPRQRSAGCRRRRHGDRRWLTLAASCSRAPGGIRHAILLTDGQNQHETRATCAAALAECEGRFTCDCRGVGTDWEVAELRTIAAALLGTVDIVADPADLAADFQPMIERGDGQGSRRRRACACGPRRAPTIRSSSRSRRTSRT